MATSNGTFKIVSFKQANIFFSVEAVVVAFLSLFVVSVRIQFQIHLDNWMVALVGLYILCTSALPLMTRTRRYYDLNGHFFWSVGNRSNSQKVSTTVELCALVFLTKPASRLILTETMDGFFFYFVRILRLWRRAGNYLVNKGAELYFSCVKRVLDTVSLMFSNEKPMSPRTTNRGTPTTMTFMVLPYLNAPIKASADETFYFFRGGFERCEVNNWGCSNAAWVPLRYFAILTYPSNCDKTQ